MYRILLVEDSAPCYTVASRALAKPEVEITWAKTVSEALGTIEQNGHSIDLVLLDLMLPDGDGLAVLDHLQNQDAFREIPVLLLTGKEDLASKVSAFSLGADDYITKPINPMELWARVEGRLRKNADRKGKTDHIKRGDLVIDLPILKASLRHGNELRDLDLTAKEFKILVALVKNEAKVLGRADLVKAVWGDSTHVISRTVDSHICGLRRKLGAHAHYIENIPGTGYRFNLAGEKAP